MPYSLSNWGLSQGDLPKVSVRIDDDLEAELLKAKSVAQRSKLVDKAIGGFVKKAMRAVSRGYDDVVDVETKAF